MSESVAAIIPTIGRPDSLERLFRSLQAQTSALEEVLVADASSDKQTEAVIERWKARGLPARRLEVQPPNAVRQRVAAIAQCSSRYLLLLDDDVELDSRCVEEMLRGIRSEPGVVAVMGDLSNEPWSAPTRAWRWYMRYGLGMREGEWDGRVVGPLLRFCFPGPAKRPGTLEWIGAGISLIEREAYRKSGGFSDFFLHRCTMNEDVDLGLKLRRVGKILFWPDAKLAHYHVASGRVTVGVAAEDDLFNRFLVLHRTAGLTRRRAIWLVSHYLLIETASNFLGMLRRRRSADFFARTCGRLRGFRRILALDATS